MKAKKINPVKYRSLIETYGAVMSERWQNFFIKSKIEKIQEVRKL